MRSFSPQIYHCFYVSHVMISRAWQEASQTIGRSADHLLILRLADGGGEAHWNMLVTNESLEDSIARRQVY